MTEATIEIKDFEEAYTICCKGFRKLVPIPEKEFQWYSNNQFGYGLATLVQAKTTKEYGMLIHYLYDENFSNSNKAKRHHVERIAEACAEKLSKYHAAFAHGNKNDFDYEVAVFIPYGYKTKGIIRTMEEIIQQYDEAFKESQESIHELQQAFQLVGLR